MRSSVLLAALLLGSSARAEEPPEPDVQALILFDSAYPQKALELQATLGVEGQRSFGDWRALELSLLVELGLTDQLQVEARVPYPWALGGEASGAEDSGIEVGLLYALVQDSRLGLVVSPGLEVQLPVSLSRSASPGLGVSPFVAVAKPLGPAHLHLNVGLEVQPPREGQPDVELRPEATFAATLPTETLVPMLEVGLRWEETLRTWVSPGLVWKPTDGIEVGVGLPARLGPGGVEEIRPTVLLTGELELLSAGK